jgi:protein-S-isoprenylcysteine O-methyltransferase Ste14
MVGACFFALWFWLLPPWLGLRIGWDRLWPWRWIPAIISALGFSVALRCVWDFGWTGRGTPAPFVPPRKLVIVGFYRYVRNPMYVGFVVGWAGLWIVFGRANPGAIAITITALIGIMAFVQLYEEPTLRGLFGKDYAEYCQHVPRWIPRLTPWTK